MEYLVLHLVPGNTNILFVAPEVTMFSFNSVEWEVGSISTLRVFRQRTWTTYVNFFSIKKRNDICDTTLRWRQTPQIVSKPPGVSRHGVRLPLKLSLSQNGPELEEICGILGQPTNVQTVSQISPLLATPRQTAQIDSQLPKVCWHGVRLPLKLSRSQNGPVLEELCGILGQPKNVQTVSHLL